MPPMSSYFLMKYFENFADFSIFPITNCFPPWHPQQNKSLWAASKEAVLMNDARFLYSDQDASPGERQTRNSENFPITEWQRWYSSAKRKALFCFAYLSLTGYHIKWYVAFSDLFSNANTELGVSSTGQVRLVERKEAFSNHNTGIL